MGLLRFFLKGKIGDFLMISYRIPWRQCHWRKKYWIWISNIQPCEV